MCWPVLLTPLCVSGVVSTDIYPLEYVNMAGVANSTLCVWCRKYGYPPEVLLAGVANPTLCVWSRLYGYPPEEDVLVGVANSPLRVWCS